jgi:hypothetical protein
MGVGQRVAREFRKFHLGPPCPTVLRPVSGVAHLQGGWPAAVFHPFGHPTPYTAVYMPLEGGKGRSGSGGRERGKSRLSERWGRGGKEEEKKV